MAENTTNANQEQFFEESSPSRASGWLLRVRGLVDVEVQDEQGRRAGRFVGSQEAGQELESNGSVDGAYLAQQGRETMAAWFGSRWSQRDRSPRRQDLPNLFEVTIPGTDYNPGPDFTTLFLSQPGRYTFRFFGRSLTAADIYLTAFSKHARLETIFFQGIPMSEQGRAEFSYDTNDASTLPVLLLVDRAQNLAQELRPTAVLSPEESEDVTPPRTSITLDGREVILSASDPPPGGSGILHTYFTTDAQTFSLYQGPFSLPADAKLVMAFSIDRNGNREYPGAVLPILGLSQTQLIFRAVPGERKVMPQNVSIFNRDPIFVTGALEWMAAPDVPWILLDRREGKTPGLLTISVDTALLEPGTSSGNIIVTSPTPGVVFAEQRISVQVETQLEQGRRKPPQRGLSGGDFLRG